jgi:hypothetical protein
MLDGGPCLAWLPGILPYNEAVTWSFLFLAALLLGLVVTATSGLLRRMTVHRLRHQVTVPAPEHHSALVTRIAQRISVPLVAFGAIGLILLRSELRTRLVAATIGGLVTAVAAFVVFREWWAQLPLARAVVARAIPENGFGQVEIDQGKRTIRLAARSEDGRAIAVGSEVELVDCESSVLTVRPRAGRAPAA